MDGKHWLSKLYDLYNALPFHQSNKILPVMDLLSRARGHARREGTQGTRARGHARHEGTWARGYARHDGT